MGGLYDRPLNNLPVATSPPPIKPRSIVYIDGFNLYYGALKNSPNKWLNLQKYFTLLRPDDDLCKIKYFTALVDGTARVRQQTYLKALATLPSVEVVLGKFKRKRVKCGDLSCMSTGNRLFETLEEKRTDVNIAVSMLDDAYQDECDHFVLISGDSDLVPAVSTIRKRFPHKKITVYVPHISATRGYAVELRTSANINRDLPLNLLSKAQFPSQLADGHGEMIHKPPTW